MTLVLSLIHAPLAFHVGDRLLTEPEKGRRKEWDPLANKSVLVLAQNGYMCISYSGLAYISGKPTDQWLAEAASGRQTIPGVRGPATLFSTTLMPRIGPALSRVRAAIQTDFASQPLRYRKNGMDVIVAGWIMRRRRTSREPRPFMLRLRHSGRPNSALVVDELPRYWDWSGQMRLGTIGVDPGEAKARLLQEIAQPVNRRTQYDYEAMLVKCIRAVADESDAVGKDCMSVLMVRQGIFDVRFLPNPDADLDRKTAYTPWVVGPGVLWPATVLYGGLPTLQAGPYQVTFERVPPLPPSSQVGAYGQPRQPFPSGSAGGQQPPEGNQS